MTDGCAHSDLTSGESRILSRMVQKSAGPVWVTLELTRRCNLRCPHCYQVVPPPDEELRHDELLGVLGQLAAMGTLFLTVTGGEVAMNAHLMALLDAAVQQRFVVKVKSNGTLWDAATLQRLRDIGIFEIHISLYHVDPQQHDQFVGRRGAWESAMNTIRFFQKTAVRVRVMVVLMNWNLDAAVPLAELCTQNGYDHTFDFRIESREDGDFAPRRLQATSEALAPLFSRIAFLSAQLQVHESAPCESDPVCALGQSSLLITSTGDVYPCGVAPGMLLGNVRQQTLSKIWNHPRRHELTCLTWGQSAACRDCEFARFCHRCPVSAAVAHGDYTQNSPMDCQMAHIRHVASQPENKNDDQLT